MIRIPANAFIQLVTAARHNVEEGVVEVPEEMIQELRSFEVQDREPSIFFKKGQFWRVENGKWIPLKLSPREAKLVQMLQMKESVPLEELQREIFGENCLVDMPEKQIPNLIYRVNGKMEPYGFITVDRKRATLRTVPNR